MSFLYQINRRITLIIGVVFLLLLQYSCVYDKYSESDDDYSALVVTRSGTVNEDKEFWEDRVVEIRMIAFDTQNGNVIHNSLLNFGEQPISKGAKSYVEEFEPGTYDFLFVANESAYEKVRKSLVEVEDIEEFNNDIFTEIVYPTEGFTPGENAPNLFLMSAYYPGIELRPSKKSEPQLFNGESGVNLVRTYAKVSVKVEASEGGTAKRIRKIELQNIPKHFTLPGKKWKLSNTQELITLTKENPFEEGDYAHNKIGSLSFYVPEFFKKIGTNPTMQLLFSGEGFEETTVPLRIDDFEKIKEEIKSLPLPPIEEILESNPPVLVRNMETVVSVKLLPQELQFDFNVLPWCVKKYEHDYSNFVATMAEWVRPTVQKEPGEEIYYVESTKRVPAIYHINMQTPKGAIWRASLTNARDFEFITGEYQYEGKKITGSIEGIAGREYYIIVAPRNPAGYEERRTEFYIHIAGKEFDPDIVIDENGNEKDGPVGIGAGNRYQVRQPDNK